MTRAVDDMISREAAIAALIDLRPTGCSAWDEGMRDMTVRVTECLRKLPSASPSQDDAIGVVERVARALFEADEDIVDQSKDEFFAAGKADIANSLGPRANWDDPRNACLHDDFRYRALAALRALAPKAGGDGNG